jgi:hypothetical protein
MASMARRRSDSKRADSEIITLDFTPEEYAQLRVAAEQEGVTIEALVRRRLAQLLREFRRRSRARRAAPVVH